MIIIPARLESTRFEHKILAKINGIPMFVKTAQNAQKADNVVVACDDEKVLDIANSYNINALLTSKNHESGTDRINEAINKLNLNNNEIIINLQADEPFFETDNLINFKYFANNVIKNGAFMASCYKIVNKNDANNPNLVKVILDKNDNAIYFSRSIIPYPRGNCETFMAHIGIYAYSAQTLHEFCSLETKELEKIEKLEQLRAISSNKTIAMMKILTSSIGIDTKQDYENAAKKFNFSIDS